MIPMTLAETEALLDAAAARCDGHFTVHQTTDRDRFRYSVTHWTPALPFGVRKPKCIALSNSLDGCMRQLRSYVAQHESPAPAVAAE